MRRAAVQARRLPMRTVWLALCLALPAACESPTAVTDGVVRVTHESGAVVIRNATAVPLGYMVVEGMMSGIIDWVPCTGPTCRTIAAHGAVTVPDSAIYGFTTSAREVVVYWWRAEVDSTARVATEAIHSLVVTL
jgi:hypothetical protein